MITHLQTKVECIEDDDTQLSDSLKKQLHFLIRLKIMIMIIMYIMYI